MPWRLPRWACITFPVPVTLKRFLAPDLVFSLGIWLSSWPQHETAREGGVAAEMLVRALKMRGFSKRTKAGKHNRHGSPCSAGRLKAVLMAEDARIGNDE